MATTRQVAATRQAVGVSDNHNPVAVNHPLLIMVVSSNRMLPFTKFQAAQFQRV